MPDFSLNLFSPVLQGKAPSGDIAGVVTGWERASRLMGGYWMGSFSVSALTRLELERWFDQLLGWHIEESVSGDVTWEGQVYELDYVLNGRRERRTLERYKNIFLANRTRTNYIDANDEPQYTDWAEQAQSVARYGYVEEMFDLDGYDTSAAEAKRATELKRRAWPWRHAVSLSDGLGGPPKLDVRVWGYCHTGNFRFISTDDEGTGNLSDWMSSIFTTDLQYLTPGKVQANTVQITRKLNTYMRAWDQVVELCSVGDASGNPYRAWVSPGRYVHYAAIDPAVRYLWKDGQILDLNRQPVHPRRVLPGVVRDLDAPQGRTEPGSFLTDSRDSLVEEVRVDEDGRLHLRNTAYNDADVLALLDAFLAEDVEGEGGERETLNWKRRIGLTPGTAEWEAAEKADASTKQRLIDEWREKKRRRG
jgi:hypothetical protein